jgi:hypothetical protein
MPRHVCSPDATPPLVLSLISFDLDQLLRKSSIFLEFPFSRPPIHLQYEKRGDELPGSTSRPSGIRISPLAGPFIAVAQCPVEVRMNIRRTRGLECRAAVEQSRLCRMKSEVDRGFSLDFFRLCPIEDAHRPFISRSCPPKSDQVHCNRTSSGSGHFPPIFMPHPTKQISLFSKPFRVIIPKARNRNSRFIRL